MVVDSLNDYSSAKKKNRMQNFVSGKQMIAGKGIGKSYHSPIKQAVKQCHEQHGRIIVRTILSDYPAAFFEELYIGIFPDIHIIRH